MSDFVAATWFSRACLENATERAEMASMPFWAAAAEATQASTFCLPKAEASERAARPRSKFSRTASEEAVVRGSKPSVADFAARAGLAAALVGLLGRYLRPLRWMGSPGRPGELASMCYAAPAKSTDFCCTATCNSCDLFAVVHLAVQIRFMLSSRRLIQVKVKKPQRNSVGE